MNRKIIILIVLFFLSLRPRFGLSDETNSDVYYLSLKQVSQLTLNNNFDIQLAKFDAQMKATDLDKEKSIFDTVIDAEIKYRNDQLKKSSTIYGTKNLTNEYNFAVTRKTSTGTTLTLNFDNERSWTNSSFTTTNPAHDSRASLNIKQELGKNFFGIYDRGNIEITRIDIENAEYTSLDKIELNLAKAQKAYFRLVLAMKSLQIKKEMLKRAEELYNLDKTKLKDGLIEMPELLAAEANLKQRKSDVLLAENELDFAMNQLKFILNLNEKSLKILPTDDFNVTLGDLTLEDSLKRAFSYRRDYIISKNKIKVEKIKLVMNKNNLWPEVNLEASFIRNGIDDHFSGAINSISGEDNSEYFVGLKINLPLENRLAKSEYNKVKLEKAKAIVTMKKIERLVLTNIVDSVRNCNILYNNTQIQKNIVSIQKNKLEEEEKRFRYGRSNTDTIIRYQDDLLNAKLLAEKAAYEYQLSLIDLALAENTLLDKYIKDKL
jgi:outer membrane protein TolC